MNVDSGDLERVLNEEEVSFLPEMKQSFHKNTCNEGSCDNLLSREDLLRIEKDEPKWRRARIILLVLFWVIWVGLLAASVLVIVFTPKCPPVPSLSFWQSKTGYWLDPFAFKDSDGDFVGDFKGIVEKLNYLKDSVGAGFVILGSFVSGSYSTGGSTLGLVDDLYSVDRILGSIEDFRSLVKNVHRNGMEIVVTLDFNSIATYHNWTKNATFLQKPLLSSMIARDGQEAIVNINGEQFYSVLGKETVDLNLRSESVISELMNVIEYWLNEGVDGILLDNVAFYLETTNSPIQPSEGNSSNKWFNTYPTNQLFVNETVDLIANLREVFEKVAKSTSRQRLLAVDSGNCGYGLNNAIDPNTKHLGNLDHPAAHLAISRQFSRHRGWKSSPVVEALEISSIKSYDEISGSFKKQLALSTATPSDQRHGDIISLASIFLLPGTPLIYYGTELAIEPTPELSFNFTFYPNNKVLFPNLSVNDSAISSHLPMPWDQSGTGYSSAFNGNTFTSYLDKFSIGETVESATSVGRGNTALQLVKSLTQLRKNPNFLWGEFALLDIGLPVSGNSVEIFTRTAEGYLPSIVVLIREHNYGSVFNFAKVCGHVIPKLSYPPNPDIPLDVTVDSSRIFLKTDMHPSVYVFDCTFSK